MRRFVLTRCRSSTSDGYAELADPLGELALDAAVCIYLLEPDGHREQTAMLCPRGCRQVLHMNLLIVSCAPKVGKARRKGPGRLDPWSGPPSFTLPVVAPPMDLSVDG